MSNRAASRGFTLVELLVSISVIAALLTILFPAFSAVREAGKRTKCLANLSGVGVGIQVYLNEHDDLLPYALPLDDSLTALEAGEPDPESILATIGSAVDNLEVFLCPSDEDIPRKVRLSKTGPIGLHSSYEYWAGWLMLRRERLSGDTRPEVAVTEVYREDPRLPVMADSADRHPGNTEVARMALYYGDWRADWMDLNPRDEASP